MGVLIAPPEAGDASVNIVPHMKKYSITDDSSKSIISTMSGKDTTNHNVLRSFMDCNYSNIMNKHSYKHLGEMENDVLRKMTSTTIADSCQFPYYRSNRIDGECPDAVLVKDVGVSCSLLKQSISEISLPGTRTMVKQLKKEYCDLSNITNKITAYTKDILNHLAKKKQERHRLRKNLAASKHAITSQYIDNKGNLYLKLRLFNNAETQCISQQSVQNCGSTTYKDKHGTKKVHSNDCNYQHYFTIPSEDINVHVHCATSKCQIMNTEQIMHGNHKHSKQEKDMQTITSKSHIETTTSSLSLSSSPVYKCLMTRKEKPLNERLNYKLINLQKYRNLKRTIDNNGSKDHLRRCSPVIFTNWKEISQLKQRNKKILSITSNESQQTASTKNNIFQDEFFDCKTNNHIPHTKLHTVNIRIIKQDNKHL